MIPILACQFLFNTGLALVMARLGSKTPDLAQLVPFITRTWMYASGVMFPLQHMLQKRAGAHPWVVDVLQANPMAVYMDLARFAFIDGFTRQHLPPHIWTLALGWGLLFGIGGFVFFWKAEERYGRG